MTINLILHRFDTVGTIAIRMSARVHKPAANRAFLCYLAKIPPVCLRLILIAGDTKNQDLHEALSALLGILINSRWGLRWPPITTIWWKYCDGIPICFTISGLGICIERLHICGDGLRNYATIWSCRRLCIDLARLSFWNNEGKSHQFGLYISYRGVCPSKSTVQVL